MKKALLISRPGKGAQLLRELIGDEQYTDITVLDSAYAAREITDDDSYDLVCINAPLDDENGVELSRDFAGVTRACVVTIVPQKYADAIQDTLIKHGVLVISKPINKHLFHHYLQFTDCFKTRMLRYTKENIKLKHLVEDIKVIDRAKLVLVSYLNMTEEQAHRYLEKQAMDLRVSKLKVAKQVIQTYEN